MHKWPNYYPTTAGSLIESKFRTTCDFPQNLYNYSLLLPAALALAHRCLASCARRLRTAILTLRFGLGVALGALVPRCFAHLARAAAAILALPTALILLRLRGVAPSPVWVGVPKILPNFCWMDSILTLRLASRRNCFDDKFVIEFILLELSVFSQKMSTGGFVSL